MAAPVLTNPTEAQFLQVLRLGAKEWGLFGEESYVERELYMAQLPLCASEIPTYWIMIKNGDGDESKQILGSCQTSPKRLIVSRPGSAPFEAVGYGIGCVIVPSQFRS